MQRHDRETTAAPVPVRDVDQSTVGRLLDSLFAGSHETIVVVGEDGLIRYASPGTRSLLGHGATALVGLPAFDFVHPDDVDNAIRLFERRLGVVGTDMGHEVRLRRASGDWLATYLTATVLPEPFAGLAITMRHAPNSRDAERGLRQRITASQFCNRLAAEFMELSDASAVGSRVERALADIAFQTGAEMVDVLLEHRDRTRVERFATWALADPSLRPEVSDEPRIAVTAGGSTELERLLSEDVTSYDADEVRSLTMLVDGAQPRSLLSAPLTMGDHRGALRLMRFQPGAEWHAAHGELARTSAGIFGRALRNARSDQLLSLTYRDGPIGYSIRTWDGELIDCNQQYLDIYRFDPEQAARPTLQQLLVPDYRTDVAAQLARLRSGAIDEFSNLVEVERLDGTRFWARTNVRRLPISGSTELLVLASVEDVTEAQDQRIELEHRARHDALTGIANRTRLAEFIDQVATRHGRLPTLIVADLDRFKSVNDLYGHQVGDRVLKLVAERLVSLTRADDLVARLAGDEFAIAIADITLAEARRLADRLTEAARVPLDVDGRPIVQTLSIGVAMGTDGTRGVHLLASADLAMYEAKQRGRDRNMFFDHDLHRRLTQRLVRERDLRLAVGRREFVVHFQPEFSLDDGHVLGAEALLRWQHPLRGLLPAAEFISVAEQSGIIDDLGRFVLREACRRFATSVRDTGRTDLILRCNISAREFARPGLVEFVLDALAESGLAPDRLCLEMTETTLMDEPEIALDTIRRLNENGVTSAIDDFGTGYSSLSYLKRFPVDTVKIDQAFVQDIVTDYESQTIVESIVHLARSMGLDVVAEGVETPEQRSVLRGLGCERGQGFLVAPGLPVDEFTEFVRGLPTLPE